MKFTLLTILKYLFFLLLGVFFVWLSIKNINHDNWLQIKHALNRGRKWILIPVFVFLLIAHYSRARRWKLLMEPLGYRPSDFNVFAAVMIGYLVNAGAPRLGEVFKCTILAKYEKVKADKLIGTILIERAVDLVSLLIIFLLAIIVKGDIFSQFAKDLLTRLFHNKAGNLSAGKMFLAAGILIVLLLLFYFILKRFGHIDLVARIKRVVRNIVHGLTSIRNLEHKRWFIFHSFLIWAMYLLSTTAGLLALRETQYMGIGGGLSVLAVGSIAMILTPNGIGAYPLLIAQLLGLYGLNADTTGNASGWLMWTVQTFVILIGGLVCFVLISKFNKASLPDTSS